MNPYQERIARLRTMMAQRGWDAVVVSGSDPHSSEYPAPRWQQVKWLTGFTGEAGDVVVTHDHAGLWTDSRYFIQALQQLEGSGVELHKTRIPGAVGIPEWLADRVKVVAFDGLCQSVDFVSELRSAIPEVHLEDVPDMLEELWEERPEVPVTPVTTLDVDSVLLSSLDEIAWMLNVRGADIDYNPLVISYLLVTFDSVKWYVRRGDGCMDPDTEDSFAELADEGVEIEEYIGICQALEMLAE